MIVRDALGYEHELPDAFDQDFEIELPFLSPWGNARMHWRVEAKLKSEQKQLTMLQLRTLGVRPSLPCTIILTRVSRGELDVQNVASCMKYVIDTIADWMGLDNDRELGKHIRFGQEKTKRKGYKAVRVTIIKGTP